MQATLAPAPEQVRTLSGIYDLIPGLGQHPVGGDRPGGLRGGRSLSELDLRDATDATVLVIGRPDESVVLPVRRQVLKAGDMLALAGAEAAVHKARALLRSGPTAQRDRSSGPFHSRYRRRVSCVSQTILVVDDDLPACRVTCRILRDAGFEGIWTNTGEHALALLVERKEAPVVDVRLTDMPGPTLAWLLGKRYGEVPVLFISGDPSFDAALLRAARWDFLAKPFFPESLVAAVRRMLAQPDVRARSAS